MTSEFMEASAEILDIFQYIPMELKNKVPDKLIRVFEKAAIKNYASIINPDKSITEQKISEKTKTILSILYLKYWANEEEKKETYKKISQNEIKYQKELREKFNPDNFWKKSTIIVEEKQENVQAQEIALAKIKKDTLIYRIINIIKRIFRRNS
ncbi:MAG: hypothetical protein ACI4UE_06970 [Candidatus Scatovivens sp.]